MRGPVRVGIIGCGSVMQHAYLPLLVNQIAQGAALAPVVCDLREDRLAQVAERCAVASATTDPEAVIADDALDIVLVLTSMREHGDLAERALRAGHHVLVEKPMSVDLEQADRLVELDRTGPAHLLCAPHVLLSPDYQQMARMIRAGAVGRPLLARARYGWDGPDWGQWFYREGGGPLFDLGVYNVTTLTGLLGPCRSVTAMAATSRPTRVVEGEEIAVETEDTYQLVLELGDGALATVTTAFGMQQYESPAVEVYGLDGTIQMLGDDWAPDGLQLWENAVGAWKTYHSRSRYWPWTDGLRHLIDCVRRGERPYTRPDHARHVLEVMLGAMEAARTGVTQQVRSTFEVPAPMPETDRGPLHLIHDRVHEDAQ
ncbi:Oxidoreductase domain protein [Nostocoides japonicum T1-X7]|uniref:Oxidoreductase domain protein n=1 Tax=Nostocoides japonicum T1-X7 TaxID=1194083 RepID=A0A077LVQ8_9MICO|nr:Gfo/Idh/MocA family oxidoreductase [Tetrasphaera japonica]CCH76045.1 Oxidoreductase domain protein [Tetrasphaera japonica T1-X7]